MYLGHRRCTINLHSTLSIVHFPNHYFPLHMCGCCDSHFKNHTIWVMPSWERFSFLYQMPTSCDRRLSDLEEGREGRRIRRLLLPWRSKNTSCWSGAYWEFLKGFQKKAIKRQFLVSLLTNKLQFLCILSHGLSWETILPTLKDGDNWGSRSFSILPKVPASKWNRGIQTPCFYPLLFLLPYIIGNSSISCRSF